MFQERFSTPNYLPELFNGDPISTACFLSFPIRTRERSKRPKTNILILPETKFHTVNDLLWFSKKQAVSVRGEARLELQKQRQLGSLSESSGETGPVQ